MGMVHFKALDIYDRISTTFAIDPFGNSGAWKFAAHASYIKMYLHLANI